MGMPVKVCQVQGMNLEEAKYHIKTMLGTSVTFITHCEDSPWHGSGQGAGNSPTLWLFISSTLFDCFETRAHGATFATPDGSKSVTLHMTGFVDDTNSRTNDFCAANTPTVEELVNLASQRDAQWWSDLVWSSSELVCTTLKSSPQRSSSIPNGWLLSSLQPNGARYLPN
jgi:hypothetical protein